MLKLPFGDYSISWLESLRAGDRSPRTLECYARDLRDVAKAIMSDRVSAIGAIDQAVVDAIEAAWKSKEVKSQTISRRFSALRNFAGYLTLHHGINCGKLLAANFPTYQRGFRRCLNGNEILALVSSEEHASWTETRDTAIFEIQAAAALTSAEVVSVNLDDFDPHRSLISVQDTHLQPRVAALPSDAVHALQKYLNQVPFELRLRDPLFVSNRGGRLQVRSVQVSFRKRARRIGLPDDALPAGLRHAVGDNLAREGFGVDVIGVALGISPSSAGRYFDRLRHT